MPQSMIDHHVVVDTHIVQMQILLVHVTLYLMSKGVVEDYHQLCSSSMSYVMISLAWLTNQVVQDIYCTQPHAHQKRCYPFSTKYGIHENVTFTSDFFFRRPTRFLVLWNAFQLWENFHFETNLVAAHVVQVHRVKKKPFYIMNVLF